MALCVYFCAPDRWLDFAYTVHAARPPHHVPPQPDTGERRGALQLQGRSFQGSEVPAHVRLLMNRFKGFGFSTCFP